MLAQILVARADPLLTKGDTNIDSFSGGKPLAGPRENPQKPLVLEAQRLLQRVQDACVRELGPDHLDSLAAMSERAMSMVRDRWATKDAASDDAAEASLARGIQERVVATLTAMLGADHPKTMASIDRLAEILWWGRALLGAREPTCRHCRRAAELAPARALGGYSGQRQGCRSARSFSTKSK